MSTVTDTVAYVIRNVFSRVRNTDSDMSSNDNAATIPLILLQQYELS